MKLTIYYFDDGEDTLPGQRYSAFVPALPTSANGATREDAKRAVLREVFDCLGFYLDTKRFTPAQLLTLTIEESDEVLSDDELAALSPSFLREGSEEIKAAE
jgi:hypothetical protein